MPESASTDISRVLPSLSGGIKSSPAIVELICAENPTDFFHNETEAGPILQAGKADF